MTNKAPKVRHVLSFLSFLGVIVPVVGCSTGPVEYKGTKVYPPYYLDCCLSGIGCESAVGPETQNYPGSKACYQMAKKFSRDNPEHLRLLKKACTFQASYPYSPYPYACKEYVASVLELAKASRIDSAEINTARQVGEQFCSTSLLDWRGIDSSGDMCIGTAKLYMDLPSMQNEAKAAALFDRGCSVKHDTEACASLTRLRGQNSVSQEAWNATQQKQRADQEQMAEGSHQVDAYWRDREQASRQSTETFNQALQQLNQVDQSMGSQPPSGFNAPATAGGMASGGETGGTCGSSCLNVECGALKQVCQQGGQAACYRATACVCRCHLNKGCSGSHAQMQQCVRDNEAKAQQLQSR